MKISIGFASLKKHSLLKFTFQQATTSSSFPISLSDFEIKHISILYLWKGKAAAVFCNNFLLSLNCLFKILQLLCKFHVLAER